eukprot:5379721-Lingulodinium_polyedra.AAC.1
MVVSRPFMPHDSGVSPFHARRYPGLLCVGRFASRASRVSSIVVAQFLEPVAASLGALVLVR